MYNTIQKTRFSNIFEEGTTKTYLQATNEKKDAAVRMKFHYVPKKEANVHNVVRKTRMSDFLEEGATKLCWQPGKDSAVRMKFHCVLKEETNEHVAVRKMRMSDFLEEGTTKAYWEAGKNGTVRKVFCYVPEKEINEMDEFAENRERFEPIIAGMRDALDQINVRLLAPDMSDEERMALRKARRKYCEKIKYFLTEF